MHRSSCYQRRRSSLLIDAQALERRSPVPPCGQLRVLWRPALWRSTRETTVSRETHRATLQVCSMYVLIYRFWLVLFTQLFSELSVRAVMEFRWNAHVSERIHA
jgi:hypothetical protein